MELEWSYYSPMVFVCGILLLLLWCQQAVKRQLESNLISYSLFLFVIPIIGLFALFNATDIMSAVHPIVILIFEEVLKAFAVLSVKTRHDRLFFLIVLFGIWELILVKPLLPYIGNEFMFGLSLDQAALYTGIMVIPVMMHSATAVIYAYYGFGHILVRILVASMIHLGFNETRDIYYQDNIAAVFVLTAELGVWALVLWGLWMGRSRPDSAATDYGRA